MGSEGDLIEADDRRWQEVVNRSVLERVPLFKNVDDIFLHSLAQMLYNDVYAQDDYLVKAGQKGNEMFFLSRGRVEVLDEYGQQLKVLSAGAFFGEGTLMKSQEHRRSVRALTDCDVLVLGRADFKKVLRDFPDFAAQLEA